MNTMDTQVINCQSFRILNFLVKQNVINFKVIFICFQIHDNHKLRLQISAPFSWSMSTDALQIIQICMQPTITHLANVLRR